MQIDNHVAIVTLLALLVYFWTSFTVGRMRHKHGVSPPAVSGAAEFERAYRVQMNTLEWLPLFLPSMWLFAWFWNGKVAAAIGVIWILARIYYAVTYVKDPAKRGPGFGVQALATFILLFGALGKAIYLAVTGGTAG